MIHIVFYGSFRYLNGRFPNDIFLEKTKSISLQYLDYACLKETVSV